MPRGFAWCFPVFSRPVLQLLYTEIGGCPRFRAASSAALTWESEGVHQPWNCSSLRKASAVCALANIKNSKGKNNYPTLAKRWLGWGTLCAEGTNGVTIAGSQ